MKCRAFPSGTFYGDCPSMLFDYLRHDIETHSQAGKRFLTLGNRAIKAFKDFLTQLARDTYTLVTHTDRDRLYGSDNDNLYSISVRRVFNRITEQISEDLAEPVLIPL